MCSANAKLLFLSHVDAILREGKWMMKNKAIIEKGTCHGLISDFTTATYDDMLSTLYSKMPFSFKTRMQNSKMRINGCIKPAKKNIFHRFLLNLFFAKNLIFP
jgi:hypothetical protein